jgi:hypothetical protein
MSIPILTTINPGGSPTTVTPTLYVSTATPTLPSNQTTVSNFPAGNKRWSRAVSASPDYITIRRGASVLAIPVPDLVALAVAQVPGLTWTPPVINTQPVNTSVAHTVQTTLSVVAGSEYTLSYAWMELSKLSTNAAPRISFSSTALAFSSTTNLGTATITSNNTTPSDGDTVVIGEKTYTFKTTLTPTEGEVLINGSADAALLNLIRAINHSGTPNTDYKCAAANVTVSAATSVTAHAFLITTKALTTASIYDVATAGSLKITPPTTTNSGTQYFCKVTDNASSPGTVTTNVVTLTIT